LSESNFSAVGFGQCKIASRNDLRRSSPPTNTCSRRRKPADKSLPPHGGSYTYSQGGIRHASLDSRRNFL